MKAFDFQKFDGIDLPVIQKNFVAHVAGGGDVLAFGQLPRLLNPVFCGHYFVDHVKPNGDVVTTKDTTGAHTSWGSQSKEAEENAYQLADAVKAHIKANYDLHAPNGKYFAEIDGKMVRIAGLTTKNF